MDLVGSAVSKPWQLVTYSVSILLSQWIWLEGSQKSCAICSMIGFNPSESMDLVGSAGGDSFLAVYFLFQSFWVNGFGWKHPTRAGEKVRKLVSILLSQWIWLEVGERGKWIDQLICFNPSESMDLVGSNCRIVQYSRSCRFQSFWVNGFGWKITARTAPFIRPASFNPSESMDLVGSQFLTFSVACRVGFQSFWVNGFGWKLVYLVKAERRSCCFNPSESMDLVGSLRWRLFSSLCCLFQSFWVNGFGWKALPDVLILQRYEVSILLSQWIWLEVNFWIRRCKNDCLFQSFWVNGFGWKNCGMICTIPPLQVSILLSQWIWLEGNQDLPRIGCLTSFNPSESMDLVGSGGHAHVFSIRYLFQSFWVNGFGWKSNSDDVEETGDWSFNPSESMDLVGRFTEV